MLRVDNKYYTWEKLEEEFPGKWVVVENPVLDDGLFIVSGELIAICEDDEVDDFVVSCYKAKRRIRYSRTTSESGVLWFKYLKRDGC